MTSTSSVATALFLLVAACDSTPPPATAKAEAKTDAKSGDAKSGDAKAKPETKSHGDAAKAAPNPHAQAMPAPAARPKGPPREITPSGETRAEKAAELSFAVPKEWETLPVASPMRIAQFVVPGPGGDAEMVVFRFAGGAGGVDANIARWKGQFVPPEGKTVDDITKTSSFEAGTLKVTLVDITGHYKAPERPGSTTMVDEDDQRMIAAIVEGSGDAFFFKLFGANKTVELWAKAYEDGLRAAKAG
jgi:hypothetical protein